MNLIERFNDRTNSMRNDDMVRLANALFMSRRNKCLPVEICKKARLEMVLFHRLCERLRKEHKFLIETSKQNGATVYQLVDVRPKTPPVRSQIPVIKSKWQDCFNSMDT